MKSNPVAGYSISGNGKVASNQYYFRDKFFAQVSSIDNTIENRLLDTGIENLETSGTPFKVSFKQNLDEKDPDSRFYYGQTVCAHWNGNQETFEGEKWKTEDCLPSPPSKDAETNGILKTYKAGNILSEGEIECSCSTLKNFYFTVITDQTYDLIVRKIEQNKTHYVLYAIIVVLLFLGAVGPCVMIVLDS